MLSRLRPTRTKEITVYVNFPIPHPLLLRNLKKNQNYLLIDIALLHNILFSPSSLHFRPAFSLLPTFSGHFSLLPIVYLPAHKRSQESNKSKSLAD